MLIHLAQIPYVMVGSTLRMYTIMFKSWEETAVSIYETGLIQLHITPNGSYRAHGVRLNGKRPVIMSVYEPMLIDMYTSLDYALHPKVDRDRAIVTHGKDGPDFTKLLRLVNELHQ